MNGWMESMNVGDVTGLLALHTNRCGAQLAPRKDGT